MTNIGARERQHNTPTRTEPMKAEELEALVEQLRALHVWPQSVADHHADVLTPRQIERLYNVGTVAHKAADALTELIRERDAMRDALEEIRDLPGEINPSNYDHDDVCELNRQFCYSFSIADNALKGTQP